MKLIAFCILVVIGIAHALESCDDSQEKGVRKQRDGQAWAKGILKRTGTFVNRGIGRGRPHWKKRVPAKGKKRCKCQRKCKGKRICRTKPACDQERYICLKKGTTKCFRYQQCLKLGGRRRCFGQFKCRKQPCKPARPRCVKREICTVRFECKKNPCCNRKGGKA